MPNYIAKGRQVVIPLTNKAANAVEYGDVVILDTTATDAFDVTTTGAYSGSWIGVVVDNDGIAVDEVGRICVCGYVPQVNLDGAAAIGDYLFTDTVAEQGTPNAVRGEGAFGQALEAGAAPSAYIWGNPDAAAGGGGAPDDAEYWVETATGDLSAEVVVGTTGITTNTYAGRQAAAKAGRLFLPSDGYYIERDTGAAWASWGPVWPMTPPVTGDFSWINQGTGTITSTYGGDYIYAPADATPDWRIRIKSAPATPYTITIALIPSLSANNYNKAGFIWRQSSDGKLVNCAVQYGGGRIISADKWTDADTYSANYASVSQYSYPAVYWLQASDTGANRVLRYSYDGTNFREIHSVGRTDYMTADQVGFGVSSENASNWAGALFLSWKET